MLSLERPSARLALAWTAFLAVVACGPLVLLNRRLDERVWAQARDRVRAEVVLLNDGIGTSIGIATAAELQARVAPLASAIELRITLIDADGTVLADSDSNPKAMDNLASRPEIVAAMTEKFGVCHRQSPTLGVDALFVAKAIRRDGRHVGWIRACVADAVVTTGLCATKALLFAAVAVAALSSAVLGAIWTSCRLRPRGVG